MVFEGLLLLVGTFLVLAIGFWRATERPSREHREPSASQASELHRV
jgi:hypothetical protein